MEQITIYKFQLETIIEALRITSNIHKSSEGKTCHDRQVRQSYQYAVNALNGEKDKEVPYMKSIEEPKSEIGFKDELLKFVNKELELLDDSNLTPYTQAYRDSLKLIKQKFLC